MAAANSLATVTEREVHSSGLKSSVWRHFGFYEHEDRKSINKSYSVCKVCKTRIKYSGNTTNMRQHPKHFHPGLEEEEKTLVVATNQRTILNKNLKVYNPDETDDSNSEDSNDDDE